MIGRQLIYCPDLHWKKQDSFNRPWDYYKDSHFQFLNPGNTNWKGGALAVMPSEVATEVADRTKFTEQIGTNGKVLFKNVSFAKL